MLDLRANELSSHPRFFVLGCLLLFVFALLCGLLGLDLVVLLDQDEPRFVTASRTMARGGDLIVPMFNGGERLDKPILIYWLQASCMALFGEGEAAARLPSILSIAACGPLVAAIGRQLQLTPVVALLSGLAFVSCLQTQVIGRAATADALLLFCTTLAAYCQFRVLLGNASTGIRLLLWTALGAAFLAKGPPALVAPCALAVGMWRAGYRTDWRRFSVGVVFMTLLVLGWAIPALARTEGRFWTNGVMHHVVERSLRPFEGHGGFSLGWYLFYLVSVPLSFLPWSAYLLKFRGLGRQELPAATPTATSLQPLLWWLGATLLVFTVVTSKLPHYPMPAFPALALLIGIAVQRSSVNGNRHNDRVIGWTLRVMAVVLAAAMIAPFPLLKAPFAPAAVLAAMTFGVGLWTAARHSFRGEHTRAMPVLGLTMLLGLGMGVAIIGPAFSRQTMTAELKENPPAALRAPDKRVHFFELTMPSATYYLEKPTNTVKGAQLDQLVELIGSPGDLLLIQPKHLPPLRELLSKLPSSQRQRFEAAIKAPHPVLRGYLPAHGKTVELHLLEF